MRKPGSCSIGWVMLSKEIKLEKHKEICNYINMSKILNDIRSHQFVIEYLIKILNTERNM